MADVLIKNLNMPKEERKVVLILKSDGEVSVYEDKHGLVRFTDANELSEHGDLVDVQAIEERAKEIQYERGITYNEALLLAFDEASVVLEAST